MDNRSVTFAVGPKMPQGLVDKINGHRIMTSQYCGEHKGCVIVTCPVDEPLDVECILNCLVAMMRFLTAEVNRADEPSPEALN